MPLTLGDYNHVWSVGLLTWAEHLNLSHSLLLRAGVGTDGATV